MTPQEYTKTVLSRESIRDDGLQLNGAHTRVMHSACGLSTEVGELWDQLKKHWFYGKPLDRVNLLEEYGDILWYLVQGINACDSTLEEVMKMNDAKLEARYQKKFSEKAALERDLENERKVLEQHSKGS